MAYISKDLKAKIAAALKIVLEGKGFKYSLAVRHHSTIVMTIQSGPIDFIGEYNAAKAGTRSAYGDDFQPVTDTMKLNQWDLRDTFPTVTHDLLKDVWKALHTDYFNNSDIMSDFHHVSHYVDLQVGRYDKAYVYQATETITLADGAHEQTLVPGVPPLPPVRHAMASYEAIRDAKRGTAPMPFGGLFDEAARSQLDLF